jgi:hypothetical protein
VLGVEIADSEVLHQVSFDASGLADGSGSFEFTVPAKHCRDGGDPARPMIRFFHRRNAELAIGAIELALIDPIEPAAMPALANGAAEPALPLKRKTRGEHRRKDLIIIGNCQAAVIHEGFHAVPQLKRHFRARYFDVNLPRHLHGEARRALEDCDVLLVQDIADWQRSALRRWVPDAAETVMFPCIRFASLWPFDGVHGPSDRDAILREAPNFTFLYLDGLLGRLRREVPDRERRFAAYRSLQIESVINYRRLHELEKRRILALDEKYDCRIGGFVLDRFQSEQVFYTTNHPNRQVFELLLATIIRRLGVKASIPRIAAFDHLRALQVPVHPKVAEGFGVCWATPDRRYPFRHEELTREQYVRRYIDHYG